MWPLSSRQVPIGAITRRLRNCSGPSATGSKSACSADSVAGTIELLTVGGLGLVQRVGDDAAVDEQVATGDIARVLAGQERHRAGDVSRDAGALHRRLVRIRARVDRRGG